MESPAGQGISDELRAAVGMLESAPRDGWTRPTRCPPWDVRQLAAHLAIPAKALTNGLRALRAELTQSAGGEPLPDDVQPSEIIATIRQRTDEVKAALDALTAQELNAILPPPAGETLQLPAASLLQLALVEIGVHCSDLAAALDRDDVLSQPVISAVAETVPTWLMFSSGDAPRPDAAISYALHGQQIRAEFAFSPETGWRLAERSEAASCRIAGTDSDLALFMLGRKPADGPRLVIEGDQQAALLFKTFLPGP